MLESASQSITCYFDTTGALERPISGVQRRSVRLGLNIRKMITKEK